MRLGQFLSPGVARYLKDWLPDRSIIEMLAGVFKFCRDPPLCIITNLGADRNSVA